MRLLKYTLFRIGIVLAAAGLLYLVGLRSWLLWVVALVVGALVSFLVLKDERLAAAQVLAEYDPLRRERPSFSAAAQHDADYEDGLVDAAGDRDERQGGDRDDGAGRQGGDGPDRGDTSVDGAPGPGRPGHGPAGPPVAGGGTDQPSASPRPSSTP